MQYGWRFIKEEKGLALVLVSLAMTALLGTLALVTDLGLVALNRNRLANACDAAALAGARELPATEQAVQAAREYLQYNGVSPLQAEVSVSNQGNIPVLNVSASRHVEYIFARAIGFTSTNVTAGARATLGGVSAATGVVPFSIPDQQLQFGVEYVLKEGAGGGENGNYGALALGGKGAENYRRNIKYGYPGRLRVGDWVETEPGNMSGPTWEGINYRINQDSHNCTLQNYRLDCPRVVIVPVYDPTTMDHGRNTVRIVGFALFLLKGVDGHGNQSYIRGYFLQSLPPTSCQASITPGQKDYGLHAVRLIE
ncbi:MAG: pilus assembly protein TadG-related protein [Bacillota bacterium]|uniref:pilus assembly protein TadG-related protein n=1 Tax=Desulfurispora thermophila TaxID=265470 RepID=UPI00036529A2|nr:pilus assembly protein TadG-related protein [Desulfurispora thermophila]